MFMVGLVFCASATVMSQHKVNMQLGETTYKTVFSELRKQTGHVVMYNNAMLDKNGLVKANFENVDVSTFLDEILKDKGLAYEITGEFIILVKETKPSNTEVEQAKKLVKGTVVDKDGMPLPGVSVFVKGTNIGISTDIDGKFELKIADKKGLVLVFSFVGMHTQEIAYTGQANIKVVLKDDSEQLEEVVVTGYQTLSRERATGSFSQIKSDVIEQKITTDVVDGLKGLTAGVLVNEENEITIRGVGSIYGDTRPLIVVDGFPVEADLSTINTADIESYTILKDAAASSIWGTRAANGVIVITTKMGKKSEKFAVDASYYLTIKDKQSYTDQYGGNYANTEDAFDFGRKTVNFRWSPASAKFNRYGLNLLQQAEYEKFYNIIDENEYNDKIASLAKNDFFKDADEYFLRKSVSQQLNVSMRGATERNSFLTSIQYNSNKGSMIGNKNTSMNINIKNDYKISERFLFRTAANFTYTKGDVNNIRISWNPTYQPLFNEDGTPFQSYKHVRYDLAKEKEALGYLPYGSSPIDESNYSDDKTSSFSARIQLGLNVKLTEALSFDTKFQYERGLSKVDNLKMRNHPEVRMLYNNFTVVNEDGSLLHQYPKGDELTSTKNEHDAWTWRNQLTFNKNLDDDKHQITVMGATEIRKYVTYGFTHEQKGFNSTSLTYMPFDEAGWQGPFQDRTWYGNSGMGYGKFTKYSEVDNRDVSVLVNAAYTFNGKYTLNMSGRVDQSNLYGKTDDIRYKPLWSAGLSWKLSDEAFLSKVSWLDNLTAKLTYGKSGSINKMFYPQLMASQETSYYGYNYMFIINPANKNLKWEEVTQTNLALDWSIFGNRVWGTFEYYNKVSNDLLGKQNLNPTYGNTDAYVNFASMRNRGVELTLNAYPIKTKDFKWETNLNFAYNKNEVTKVTVAGESTNSYLYELGGMDNIMMEKMYGFSSGSAILGKPISRLYAYKYAGLNDKGEPMLYDKDDNKVVYYNLLNRPEDLKYMGGMSPTTYGNFRNSFTYKDLTFAFNFIYQLGHYFRKPVTTVSGSGYGLVRSNVSEMWEKKGDEATKTMPGVSGLAWYQYTIDDFYRNADINVLKGDNIRLDNVSLNYNLPESLTAKTPFKSLNVKVQARNLWLWTANDEDIDPSSLSGMPMPKSIVFGIKASF